MPDGSLRKPERDIDRWAVEVMRGVARALRKEQGPGERTAEPSERLDRVA